MFMGWLGTHPMAGDDPLNVIDLFKAFVFGDDRDKVYMSKLLCLI